MQDVPASELYRMDIYQLMRLVEKEKVVQRWHAHATDERPRPRTRFPDVSIDALTGPSTHPLQGCNISFVKTAPPPQT